MINFSAKARIIASHNMSEGKATIDLDMSVADAYKDVLAAMGTPDSSHIEGNKLVLIYNEGPNAGTIEILDRE